jgi:hypothetical protein
MLDKTKKYFIQINSRKDIEEIDVFSRKYYNDNWKFHAGDDFHWIGIFPVYLKLDYGKMSILDTEEHWLGYVHSSKKYFEENKYIEIKIKEFERDKKLKCLDYES